MDGWAGRERVNPKTDFLKLESLSTFEDTKPHGLGLNLQCATSKGYHFT